MTVHVPANVPLHVWHVYDDRNQCIGEGDAVMKWLETCVWHVDDQNIMFVNKDLSVCGMCTMTEINVLEKETL